MNQEQDGFMEGAGGYGIYEDELYGKRKETEVNRKVVLFCLDQEWYAIDVDCVKQVESDFSISVLPFVPDYIKGIVHFRGNIISVSDLKAVFGLTGPSGPQNQRIVVIESEGINTGLLVDMPVKFAEVPASNFTEPNLSGENERSRFISAQAEWEGQLIVLLDAKKIIEKTRLE